MQDIACELQVTSDKVGISQSEKKVITENHINTIHGKTVTVDRWRVNGKEAERKL